MDNAEYVAKLLHLAFQLEGLSVGSVQIRPHGPDLFEAEIDGKGPFILPATVLGTSDPEAGYVSEALREWIDHTYLDTRCK